MTDRCACSSGRNLVATLFLSVALTACGGGGGGGGTNSLGSGGSANPPGGSGGTNNAPLPAPITYSGVTTQAALGVQSSPVIAGALLYELGLASAPRPLPTGQVQKARVVAKLARTAAKASKASRIAMKPMTTESCATSGTVTVDDQTNASGIGTVRLTYAACVEDGVTTNGDVVLTFAAYDLARDVPTDFTASFHGYTETSGGSAIDIGGTIRSVASLQSETTTYNTVTRYRPENVEYRLQDVVVTQTPLPQAGSVSLRVQGRMYHSTFGYVDVTTSTSLTFNTYSLAASAGALRMQGSASSSSELTFQATNQMRLSLDENGDGTAERAMQATNLAQLTIANHRPSANAGPDLTIAETRSAVLTGSGSDWEGDPLTYEWAIISGPLPSQVIGNAAQVNFTPIIAGTYLIQLRVSDVPSLISTDTMTLVVTPNADPVARAGADVTTSEGMTVVLNGNATTDAENDPITFSWSLVSAPAGSTAPSSVAGQSWNFVPDRPGLYEYRLRAADASGFSFDNVRITADYLIAFGFSSSIAVDASTTLAAAQRSASVNVSARYSGTPIGLSASTNVSWLNVVSAPANTSSGGNLIVGIVPAQVALLANGTHSAQVTITPAGYTPRTVTIALNLQLPDVEHVTPYVAYEGRVAPVALYGKALEQTMGGTLLVDGMEVQGFTDASATRSRITLPALPVGEYELRVENNLGIERTPARFVVREAPTYPDGEIDVLGRIEDAEYDMERDAFYIVSYDLNDADFDTYRLRYDGAQWQRDPIPVTAPMALSLNVDGTRLYVTSADCGVTELDPDTLAVLQTSTKPSCYYEFFGMISGFADGRIVVADTDQWPTEYNYPAFTAISPSFPTIHNPIHLLNNTRERLLWAESPTISRARSLHIYDVATRSFQAVAIHDPGTYFLPYYLGISGDGSRFMHGADVYDDGQYIGSLQGVGAGYLNPALTHDGTRAVAFDPSTDRLSVFDLTSSGPSFPLITDVMTAPDAIGSANMLRLLPDDSVAFFFTTRHVPALNAYAYRAYVRNMP